MKGVSHFLRFLSLFTVIFLLSGGAVQAQDVGWPQRFVQSAQDSSNLLYNGSMEMIYDWFYPNHFVAHGWNRWWIDGSVLPEYDSSRIQRPHYDGRYAQVYFKWGPTYHAGIYQVIENVTPCVPYRFTMEARNHSLDGVLPHAKIGLDTAGTQIVPDSPNHGAVKNGLPATIQWSREQTALFVWEQLSVVAVPTGSRLTAIVSANPEPPAGSTKTYYYDTYWDAGVVTQQPYTNDRLPDPVSWRASNFISNISTHYELDNLVVEWDTAAPAHSQLQYNVTPQLTPSPPPTGTGTIITPTFRVYFPFITRQQYPPSGGYQNASPLSYELATHHHAVIPHLTEGSHVDFVILAHYPDNAQCVTVAHGPQYITVDFPYEITHLYLPLIKR